MTDRRSIAFYTKADCLLCDEASELVEAVAPFLGIEVRAVDIADDATAQDAFADRVPVLAKGDRVLVEGSMSRIAVAVAMLKVRFGLG